jgi:hypothetical protein
VSDGGPVVGATYALQESDYKFGTGPLMVQVTRVIEPVLFDADTWWHVEGMCRHPADPSWPGHARELYIRADRLPGAIRPA